MCRRMGRGVLCWIRATRLVLADDALPPAGSSISAPFSCLGSRHANRPDARVSLQSMYTSIETRWTRRYALAWQIFAVWASTGPRRPPRTTRSAPDVHWAMQALSGQTSICLGSRSPCLVPSRRSGRLAVRPRPRRRAGMDVEGYVGPRSKYVPRRIRLCAHGQEQRPMSGPDDDAHGRRRGQAKCNGHQLRPG